MLLWAVCLQILIEDGIDCLFVQDRVPAASCLLVRLDPRAIAIFRSFPPSPFVSSSQARGLFYLSRKVDPISSYSSYTILRSN